MRRIYNTSLQPGRPWPYVHPGRSRVQQMAEWLGSDFDGVIVFDEAHKMKAAMSFSDGTKKHDQSQTARAGMELQNALPQARVVYASATGATDLVNMTYLDRIGLWVQIIDACGYEETFIALALRT